MDGRQWQCIDYPDSYSYNMGALLHNLFFGVHDMTMDGMIGREGCHGYILLGALHEMETWTDVSVPIFEYRTEELTRYRGER